MTRTARHALRTETRHGNNRQTARRGAGGMTVLHLRARNVPAYVLGLLILTLLAWWAADWLSSRPYFDGPRARPPVAGLAPALAAVLMSVTLGAADEELERSTARPWRRIRLVHVTALTTSAAFALASTGLWEADEYGAYELVRNTATCAGMVAGAAAVVGAKLAWAPVFTYVVAVYIAAPKPPQPQTSWWTWPVQPSSASPSWWTAVAWLAVGSALYAARGARAARDRDA